MICKPNMKEERTWNIFRSSSLLKIRCDKNPNVGENEHLNMKLALIYLSNTNVLLFDFSQ